MIGGPSTASTSRERADGYREALREAGIADDPSLYRESRFSQADGMQIGLELLQMPEPPTALLTANSFLAFGAIAAAESLGLSVPGDLAIASFDDFEIGPREPILTCVDQPAGDIAELAARRLLARLRGDDSEPRTVVVGTDLRIRTSCGGARARTRSGSRAMKCADGDSGIRRAAPSSQEVFEDGRAFVMVALPHSFGAPRA